MQSSPQNIALFNNSSTGIVVADPGGIIIFINPFALQLFGYTPEEIVGRAVEVLIPNRFHRRHVSDRQAYLQNPKSRPMGLGMDLFAVKNDGTEFPVEVSLSSYQNNGDKNVIAFINDITIRKQAEKQVQKVYDELEITVEKRTKDLQKTLKQLELSSKMLEDALSYQKALFNTAGAIIIATGEEGIIKLFNLEASRNLGYSESEIVNKKTPLIFHDLRELQEKRKKLQLNSGIFIEGDLELLIEKSKLDVHEEEQYHFIRKDGTSFPVSMTLTTIYDNAGNTKGYMVIAIDISKRKKAEDKLKKALEREKDLSELKSNFVSMASHEFRTPLSTVLSSAYLIEKYSGAEDQSKREKHLQRIISSVNMLTEILDDFLSVGKIEEGKIQVRLSEINIETVIKNIVEEIKNNLRNKQQILYCHEGNANLVTDPSLLKHIVMNLVSNASKFSPEDSWIEIKTNAQKDQLTLSVKDDGIGISQEDQKHLMERFFRASNANNIQGTGLGLHIVSKYAELLNATVSCQSELEKGTQFFITFNLSNQLS